MSSRKIIHIDMDCFYAAVEMKFQPHLRGKAIAVGGSPGGRGVITTASYEARKFGVKSAMPPAHALKLCPHLIFVRNDFAKYRGESIKVREILERYSDRIEPLSLDEAYLDVSGSAIEQGSATRIAERIRREIREELQLTASAGVAPNKFLAKIASDLNKPDGITVIRPDQIDEFMKRLPIGRIWGVGKVTAAKLNGLGIQTCLDLQKYTVAELERMFGSWGPRLYDFARGIDNREVSSDRERKSLTVESTFGENLIHRSEILNEAAELYADFSERMIRHRARGEHEHDQVIRSVVVKLKFDNFRQKGRERKWDARSSTDLPPLSLFREIFEEALDGETLPVRLIGLGVRFHAEEKAARPSRGPGDADGLQLKF